MMMDRLISAVTHPSILLRAAILAIALLACAAPLALAGDPVDCSKGDIAAGPAKGTIDGAAFSVDSVRLDPNDKRTQNGVAFDEYHIYLTDKAGAVLDLTAITPTGKLPDGRTFRSGLEGDSPEAGPGSAEIQGWDFNDETRNLEIAFYEVNDASLQIVFGQRSGDSLPAQIHFCVPSKMSEVAGRFTIPLK
jgi:hypothetical protein